ncbi:unnamed protein product, partial [Amoebophrya sp. A120]
APLTAVHFRFSDLAPLCFRFFLICGLCFCSPPARRSRFFALPQPAGTFPRFPFPCSFAPGYGLAPPFSAFRSFSFFSRRGPPRFYFAKATGPTGSL